MASIKLCWEPTPRALYHQRYNGPTTHIISYLEELAVRIPTLEAWDQMVWPTTVTILHVLTEAESYGYCRGQAVDLGPMMPAVQFRVTEEGGTYLCTTRALVFEGSILTYNPTLNEAEWMPVHCLANDLSWAEERSAVALANYVPHASAEAAWIARLGAGRVISCPVTTPPHQRKGRSCGIRMHPVWILTVRWGMRMRRGQTGRRALEMRQKQTRTPTNTGALKTGRPLWKSQKG